MELQKCSQLLVVRKNQDTFKPSPNGVTLKKTLLATQIYVARFSVESTRCNHGHFYPHYVESRDRKTGFRGMRLEAPGGLIQSTPGLRHSADGAMGLEWSEWQPLDQLVAPNSPGVYRIAEGNRVMYVGESFGLRVRLKAHARNDWDQPVAAFCVFPPNTPKQHLHEIENDLIAGHYDAYGSPPAMQFSNVKVARAQGLI